MVPEAVVSAYQRIAETNAEWAASISATTRKIQSVLRDVWPDVECLSDSRLYSLATLIEVIRVVTKKQRNQPPLTISALVSAAKKFQRELANSRGDLITATPPELIEYCQSELNKMDAARDAVTALQDHYKLPRRDPARDIATTLSDAWRLHGTPIQWRVKPDDPLCRAVTALLGEAGINYSPEHVSDKLRAREHRSRSGRRRSGSEGAQNTQ